MEQVLVVDWNTSTFKTYPLEEVSRDQDILKQVDDGDADLIKAETVRGEEQYRRAILNTVEADEEEGTEEKIEINDWELIR